MRLLLLALLYPTQPTTEATITVVPLPRPYPGRSPTIIDSVLHQDQLGSGGRHDEESQFDI